MIHTFADAKRKLAAHMSAYSMVDPSAAVNEAVDELAQTKSWQRLRKVIRFTLAGENFALPQDCGRLIRCAVDSRPVTVFGQDYDFLQSGPGDLDYVAAGYTPVDRVQRLGLFPVMNPLEADAGLVAFSATPPSDPVAVRVRLPDGEITTQYLTVAAGDPDASAAASADCSEILSVVLPPRCEAYINLYAKDAAGTLTFVSHMHPSVLVPEFARYRMPGLDPDKVNGYRVLAEVGMKFLPLVADDDVLPFPSLRPVQYMLRSFASMDSGEVKEADDYRARAELELMRREDVENERQSVQIINPLYEGSDGQVCEYWEGV